MKFGGSSVGSAAAIKRVASIVRSQVQRKPVVVVSAFGETTDQLAAIVKHAASGESYLAWKLIKELREFHFGVAEELLGSREMEVVDQHLRETFRDLHVRMAEACDGERRITPAETDAVLSLGEQLSSLIVDATFRQLGIPSCHLDARKLILTDNQFSNATPRYWETYAKIRWAVPVTASRSVVVMGGFIAATEQGQTTTLGRGGSDLTATLVAAAINADEVQIWKDVDGILTTDPRLRSDAWLVKRLSYEEAAELAQAGAKVLHPETIAPAQRLRIPISLRNTFKPEAEGTSIGATGCCAAKSIVCKPDVTLLEISSGRSGVSIGECSAALNSLLGAEQRKIEVLGTTECVLYLALEGVVQDPAWMVDVGACMETHLRVNQALLTLVGDGIATDETAFDRMKAALSGLEAFILPREASAMSLRVAVPKRQLTACLQALHQAFFAAPDLAVFAKPALPPVPRRETLHPAKPRDLAARVHQALALTEARWLHN